MPLPQQQRQLYHPNFNFFGQIFFLKNALAVENALVAAANAVEHDLVNKITENMADTPR